MSQEKYQYIGCCVHLPAEDVIDMVDREREITYRTFCKYVDIKDLNIQFGYDVIPGMTLGSDYAVSFHRSKYRNTPCVYMRHSAIEYIFTKTA